MWRAGLPVTFLLWEPGSVTAAGLFWDLPPWRGWGFSHSDRGACFLGCGGGRKPDSACGEAFSNYRSFSVILRVFFKLYYLLCKSLLLLEDSLYLQCLLQWLLLLQGSRALRHQ